LVLRLIGLAFDVYDGSQKSASQDALKDVPSLLSVLSYTLFYGGVTVGPQFSFALFNKFVMGTLVTTSSGKLAAGFSRLLLGLVYVGIVAVGMGFFPDSRIFLSSFIEVCFLFCLLSLSLSLSCSLIGKAFAK
jgi:hypothetical protein